MAVDQAYADALKELAETKAELAAVRKTVVARLDWTTDFKLRKGIPENTTIGLYVTEQTRALEEGAARILELEGGLEDAREGAKRGRLRIEELAARIARQKRAGTMLETVLQALDDKAGEMLGELEERARKAEHALEASLERIDALGRRIESTDLTLERYLGLARVVGSFTAGSEETHAHDLLKALRVARGELAERLEDEQGQTIAAVGKALEASELEVERLKRTIDEQAKTIDSAHAELGAEGSR